MSRKLYNRSTSTLNKIWLRVLCILCFKIVFCESQYKFNLFFSSNLLAGSHLVSGRCNRPVVVYLMVDTQLLFDQLVGSRFKKPF